MREGRARNASGSFVISMGREAWGKRVLEGDEWERVCRKGVLEDVRESVDCM